MGSGYDSVGKAVASSNPVIGNFYIEHMFTVILIDKTIIKEKRSGMAHLKRCVLIFRHRPHLLTQPSVTAVLNHMRTETSILDRFGAISIV